jgi:hypothetical protein
MKFLVKLLLLVVQFLERHASISASQYRRKRICCNCGEQILLRHRWHGKNTGKPQHDDCEQPGGFPLPPTEPPPISADVVGELEITDSEAR